MHLNSLSIRIAALLILPCLLKAHAQDEAGKKEPPSTIPDHALAQPADPNLTRHLLDLPLSATVSNAVTLESAAVRSVKDAAIYAPNTFMTELSARKYSNPYFRGIGASAMNPGVITYIDGVPQFSANSSNLELLDIQQIDFMRGPVGALYGRNSVGGLIHLNSSRPTLSTWSGNTESTFGNYGLYDFRGSLTGPLIQDQLGFSFAGGYREREGFSHNASNGADIDHRSAWFGKGQLLWQPNEDLEVRLILAGESAKDGDYALQDVSALRQQERQLTRNFYGHTSRDVIQPTLQITYHAESYDLISNTGLVWWRTDDLTDFDYTDQPLLIRRDHERMLTLTQEFRLQNPTGSPIALAPHASLQWHAGLFLFHSQYRQNAANTSDIGFLPVAETLSQSRLNQSGIGFYGQGIITLWDQLDILAGLRLDIEHQNTKAIQTITPGSTQIVDAASTFAALSPQLAISYRFQPELMGYLSLAGGSKPGGFNVDGSGEFSNERTWNYELGIKGHAFRNDLNYTLAVFYTDIQDMQISQIESTGSYINTNVGNARSQGIEFGLDYRYSDCLMFFGSTSWQDARFTSGTIIDSMSINDRNLPYAPEYQVTLGILTEQPLRRGVTIYARADIQLCGAFKYSAQNNTGQDAYTLANFRLGIRCASWFSELFMNNAFNIDYVPVAMNYPIFGSPRLIGENGAPCTFGLRVGMKF